MNKIQPDKIKLHIYIWVFIILVSSVSLLGFIINHTFKSYLIQNFNKNADLISIEYAHDIGQIAANNGDTLSFYHSADLNQKLTQIQNNQMLTYVYFMDTNNVYVAGNTNSITNKFDNSVFNHLKEGETVRLNLFISGSNIYFVIIPIKKAGLSIGSLVLGHNKKSIENPIHQVRMLIFAILSLFALLFCISILLIFRRNNKLAYQAYHDSLTNLPNLNYLDKIIQYEQKNMKSSTRTIIVVCYKNLDYINTLYGFHASENIINETSCQLKKLCNPHLKLFHIAYDRFAFYVTQPEEIISVKGISNKAITIMKDYAYSNFIGGCVGIYQFNTTSEGTEEIIKRALLAATSYKKEERFTICSYDEAIENVIKREERIEDELQKIIYNTSYRNHFFLEFQPVVELKSKKIIGFEALARMKSDVLGPVSPVEFINVAEKTKLIIPLGEIILSEAMEFLQFLYEENFYSINIAVNVSGIQILRPDFIHNLKLIINTNSINSSNVDLELTESVFATDIVFLKNTISKLKDMDIGIFIDDFGTGYSSFSRGSDLDISTIKIDKIFIDKLHNSNTKKSVTSDIIAMSHKLGHKVVAEGVEFKDQLDYLINYDCDYVQGYFYSKPLKASDALSLLRSFNQ